MHPTLQLSAALSAAGPARRAPCPRQQALRQQAPPSHLQVAVLDGLQPLLHLGTRQKHAARALEGRACLVLAACAGGACARVLNAPQLSSSTALAMEGPPPPPLPSPPSCWRTGSGWPRWCRLHGAQPTCQHPQPVRHAARHQLGQSHQLGQHPAHHVHVRQAVAAARQQLLVRPHLPRQLARLAEQLLQPTGRSLALVPAGVQRLRGVWGVCLVGGAVARGIAWSMVQRRGKRDARRAGRPSQ
jgi:hypothetical protein